MPWKGIQTVCPRILAWRFSTDGCLQVKYVALLSFNRIVASHPGLVSMQQDVIMGCLDDLDISIRLQALELVSGMVTSDTLQTVVNRLITQLQTAPTAQNDGSLNLHAVELLPSADMEGEDPEERLEPMKRKPEVIPALPAHYRNEVLHKIMDICARDNYSSVSDFEWYIDVLVQLVRLIPPSMSQHLGKGQNSLPHEIYVHLKGDIATRIGVELRNIAVRVRSVRMEATRAAELLILIDNRETYFPITSVAGFNILEPVSWIVGEYADHLAAPERTLNSLIHSSNIFLPTKILSSYLQAIPKLLVSLISNQYGWNADQQSRISLFLARIVGFFEQLASHPDLDVQERAIEFLELLRLTAEAVSSNNMNDEGYPLLLSSAIPSLFSGLDLNPVAAGAQKKVPVPENLDLDKSLHDNIVSMLSDSENGLVDLNTQDEFHHFYYTPEINNAVRPDPKDIVGLGTQSSSYQQVFDDATESEEIIARRRAERRERNRDDPFYIGNGEGSSGTSTPFHQVLKSSNGEELDLDSIPIIDLAIDRNAHEQSGARNGEQRKKGRSKPKKVEILADETIDTEVPSTRSSNRAQLQGLKAKRSVLEVDSSGLSRVPLEEDGPTSNIHDLESKETEEEEMMKAMKEVERLRLEMQRASERIHVAQGVPPEGTLVKRKKKKKTAPHKNKNLEVEEPLSGGHATFDTGVEASAEASGAVAKKKKRKSSKKERANK